jgi:hypothetical protein
VLVAGICGAADVSSARVLRLSKPVPQEVAAPSSRGGAPEAGRSAPSARIAPRPIRRLPLDLGRVTPVFERRRLERRPAVMRGAPDTVVVKVAMLRIEFATDRRGDQTTGDGRMMRTNPDSTRNFIDAPPTIRITSKRISRR